MRYIIIYTILFLSFFSNSYGFEENNKIEQIEISVKNASNAKEAKLKGIEDGKKRALILLLSKITPSKNFSLEHISNQDIENFITSFEIHNEKLSPKSYNALIDVSFNLSLVNKAFSISPTKLANNDFMNQRQNTRHNMEQEENSIICYCKINDISEWVLIRNLLEKQVEGVKYIRALSVDKEKIIFEILFNLDPAIIANNMFKHRLVLEQDQFGKIELKRNI